MSEVFLFSVSEDGNVTVETTPYGEAQAGQPVAEHPTAETYEFDEAPIYEQVGLLGLVAFCGAVGVIGVRMSRNPVRRISAEHSEQQQS